MSLASAHRLVAVVLAASLVTPQTSHAAPAAESDLSRFDAGFRRGQEEYNRGEYRSAAKIWIVAAELLPESEANRDNRAAIYEYIADAYRKTIEAEPSEDVLHEALRVLDAYAEGFSAAYPGQTLPEQVVKARVSFRAELGRLKGAGDEVVGPPPPPPPAPVHHTPAKPWKGLTIAGGVTLGAGAAMLVMFAAAVARTERLEREFDDPANACGLFLDDLGGAKCSEIYRRGVAATTPANIGLFSAPLLIGAGVALLAVGLRRRARHHAVTPALGPGGAGLSWRVRF